jgi:phage terminase small subunit
MIPLRFKNKLLSLFKNEDIKNYINSVNFSTNEEEFFQLLDFMQKLHPEYNIKEVYRFYYE